MEDGVVNGSAPVKEKRRDGEPRLEIGCRGMLGEFMQLSVFASNQSFSGSIWIYCRKAGLAEFGTELQSFPDRRVINYSEGYDEPTTFGYLQLRAYVLDRTGHSTLEVTTRSCCDADTPGDAPEQGRLCLGINCDPARLNDLGKRLTAWIANPEGDLIWTTRCE